MSKQFQLTVLFNNQNLTNLVRNFGFKRMTQEQIKTHLQSAFSDYIVSALSELATDNKDNNKMYVESVFHLEKAKKLLAGMPHPAGKMSYRLSTMINTLQKLIEGKDNFAADRATRFMEKNLVRRLRDLWVANTPTPFHPGSDGSGKNPRDFILQCFNAAGEQHPEINWFKEVDYKIADQLIKSIRR